MIILVISVKVSQEPSFPSDRIVILAYSLSVECVSVSWCFSWSKVIKSYMRKLNATDQPSYRPLFANSKQCRLLATCPARACPQISILDCSILPLVLLPHFINLDRMQHNLVDVRRRRWNTLVTLRPVIRQSTEIIGSEIGLRI